MRKAQDYITFKAWAWAVFFYLGIDPRVVLLSTAEAPGHHPLQLTITRQWAAGVALSAAGTAQVEIKLGLVGCG